MTTPHSKSKALGIIDPLSFLTMADLDYVAARSLLLSGLIVPGNAKAERRSRRS